LFIKESEATLEKFCFSKTNSGWKCINAKPRVSQPKLSLNVDNLEKKRQNKIRNTDVDERNRERLEWPSVSKSVDVDNTQKRKNMIWLHIDMWNLSEVFGGPKQVPATH